MLSLFLNNSPSNHTGDKEILTGHLRTECGGKHLYLVDRKYREARESCSL
jgi:hypothetical protein